MERRQFTTATLVALLGAVLRPGHAMAAIPGLGEGQAADGVRAAIERGAESAVALLGKADGFLGNPKVRIPLPDALNDASKMLKMLGQQQKIDELVVTMNRAAEGAVPEAKAPLVAAVKPMSAEDALRLVRGSETAVTEFFERKTRVSLGEKFLPIVTQWTEKLSLAQKYNAVAGKAQTFGLVRQEDATVERYVTRKALDGLYLMIGDEERKIRADPIGTGSDILRKVFG